MRNSKTVLCLPIMLAALPAGAQTLAQTPAPTVASPYAPLAFLAGHCWQGMLPGGKDADTHCFSWIYDGKFVRDQHTVHGAGHADHLGESIYYWDSAGGKLQYLYVESDGGSSQGTVEASGDALVFPATNFQEDGQIQAYRSRWSRSGDDAYDVVTEFRKKDSWVIGWTVHMQKVPYAPPKL